MTTPKLNTKLSLDEKKAIVVRVYHEEVENENPGAMEAFIDGIWFAFRCCGVSEEELAELAPELNDLLDGYIEGEWDD